MTISEFKKWLYRDGKINTIDGPRYLVVESIHPAISPASKLNIFLGKWFSLLIGDEDLRIQYILSPTKPENQFVKLNSRVINKIYNESTFRSPGFIGGLASWRTLKSNITEIEKFTNEFLRWPE